MPPESEAWLPIAGHEGAYEVSDLGRVRSLPGGKRQAKVLRPCPAGRGYLTVSMSLAGVVSRAYVHHLVAAAFVGPRPDGLDICHSNGDMLDNRAENLRYDTASGNNRDAIAQGRNRESARTHCDHGHEFTPDNTRVQITVAPDGHLKHRRVCRTCRKRTSRITYLRRREREAA